MRSICHSISSSLMTGYGITSRIRCIFRQATGSVFHFNQEAYERLEGFEEWVKTELACSPVLHADETGINSDGKRHWLHCASHASLTWFSPHAKRGTEAMDEIGIGPGSRACCATIMGSPHRYECTHALCNAHHLRELERAWEQDQQQWAKEMQALLVEIAKATEASGGSLPPDEAHRWRRRTRRLLAKAESEVPRPMKANEKPHGVGSNDPRPATCWSDFPWTRPHALMRDLTR